MSPRALWKGHLKIAEIACPVALHAAASTAERVSFRTVSRRTGNPVRRDYVDEETEEHVAAEDQVKGYETDRDRYVLLTPEEIAAAVPASDKTLHVSAFLACPDIDTTYFDKPYYLSPADRGATEVFALIREAMRARGAAALARAVLFRRCRTVLIRAQGPGLVANTLNFDYEVRAARRAFARIPDREIDDEMLDLARHIIATKSRPFDPAEFDDRYDAALAELVRAKAEGRAIPRPEPAPAPGVIDLREALRRSAGAKAGGGKAGGGKAGGGRAATGKSAAGKAKPKAPAGSAPRRKAS
jgi:DNA end-binding protein Ku